MSHLVIRAGDVTFDAVFEDRSAPKNQSAPRTCAAFRRDRLAEAL